MKLLASLLFFVSLAAAQGTDAVLTGEVLDASGAHVPDAVVTALNIKTGVSTGEKSNGAGVYLFPVLPPGDYRISAEKPGFKKYIVDQLTLRTGDHVEQNLTLDVGVVSDSVQVEADSEAVNYLTSSQGGLLNT